VVTQLYLEASCVLRVGQIVYLVCQESDPVATGGVCWCEELYTKFGFGSEPCHDKGTCVE
jgi:hypothetical protein